MFWWLQLKQLSSPQADQKSHMQSMLQVDRQLPSLEAYIGLVNTNR